MFYVRIMQSENFATNIHTHYRQSETAPIYAHYTREKFRHRYIWELRRGMDDVCEVDWRWHLGVRLYHVLYMRSSFG